MLLNRFQLFLPTSTIEAAKLYQELDDVKVLAGGTFIMNSLKLLKTKGTKTASNILSLAKVPELKGIYLEAGILTINAMTTVTELLDCPLLSNNLTVLRTVCRNISTNPIRNMATIGGNLTCRYTWTEMGAVMIALDASMHFLSAEGQLITVSAEEFFQNNARAEALFTHVTIPHQANVTSVYRRVKKTMHVDVPLLAVCLTAIKKTDRLENVRIGINNGTAFAKRDATLEAFLNKTLISNDLPNQALAHLTTEIYDHRSTDYKKHLFRVSIKQAIEQLIT